MQFLVSGFTLKRRKHSTDMTDQKGGGDIFSLNVFFDFFLRLRLGRKATVFGH